MSVVGKFIVIQNGEWSTYRDACPDFAPTQADEWLVNLNWAAIEATLPWGKFDTWPHVRRNLLLLLKFTQAERPLALEDILYYLECHIESRRQRLYEKLTQYWFNRFLREIPLFFLHPVRPYEIPHGMVARVKKSPHWQANTPNWYGDPALLIQALYARIKAVGNLLVIPVKTTRNTDRQWSVMLRPSYNSRSLTENHASLAFDTCMVQTKNIKPDFVGFWGTFSLHMYYEDLLTPPVGRREWMSQPTYAGTLTWRNTPEDQLFYPTVGRDKYRIGRASWCISQFWKALIMAEKAAFLPQVMLGAHPNNPDCAVKRMTKSWLYERQLWRTIGSFLTG